MLRLFLYYKLILIETYCDKIRYSDLTFVLKMDLPKPKLKMESNESMDLEDGKIINLVDSNESMESTIGLNSTGGINPGNDTNGIVDKSTTDDSGRFCKDSVANDSLLPDDSYDGSAALETPRRVSDEDYSFNSGYQVS